MADTQEKPLVVICIGGNSLEDESKMDEAADAKAPYKIIDEQRRNLLAFGTTVAALRERYQVVVSHGNGPQVGASLQRVELAQQHGKVYPLPLHICVADTQGGIGYLLAECVGNRIGDHAGVAAVVTSCLVDAADPAFDNPTKPVGAFFADPASVPASWKTKKVIDDPKCERPFRRVVPSPTPTAILQIGAVRALLAAGITPIACGGGGVPVVEATPGDRATLAAVDGVIDKDLAGSQLARDLNAEFFVISTGVDTVFVNWRKPDEKALRKCTAAEIQEYADKGNFPAGSMGPKVRAAVRFLTDPDASDAVRRNRKVLITSPQLLADAIARGPDGADGKPALGTWVLPN